MNDWQTLSLISLTCWAVLAVGSLRSHRLDASIVFKSILIWGGIVLVITAIVLNLELIRAALAPIRAMMP
jgi:hypothetical protein